MAITFYAASGSPYASRAWLALEHKALPYELRMLSFSAGDLAKPEYVAINPRRKVPAIVDDGFALYESPAIVRYLEDAYPSSGQPLFPGDAKQRGLVHRMVAEVDAYVAPAIETLVAEVLFKSDPATRDAGAIERGTRELAAELARFEGECRGPFLAGEAVSAADHSLYPLIALGKRMDHRFGVELGLDSMLGKKLVRWTTQVQALPHFATTYPPHWRAST